MNEKNKDGKRSWNVKAEIRLFAGMGGVKMKMSKMEK